MTLRVKILAGQKNRMKGELTCGFTEPSTGPCAASRAQPLRKCSKEFQMI